jgi:hypothetical protein
MQDSVYRLHHKNRRIEDDAGYTSKSGGLKTGGGAIADGAHGIIAEVMWSSC